MGFFSVFNSNHISSSTLHKSNIPSEFGGRLSGILEVSPKNEIPEKVTGNIDAGILSSQATIGIPVGNKSGLYLSGRVSYFNYMLKSIEKMMNGADAPHYFFDDFNLTWLMAPDSDNRIRINAYYGTDRMDFSQETYQAGAGLRYSGSFSETGKRFYGGFEPRANIAACRPHIRSRDNISDRYRHQVWDCLRISGFR